jgi:hypothetical protein
MNARFDYARYDHVRPIRWTGDALELLDQRKLPFAVEYVRCTDSASVAEAIHASPCAVHPPSALPPAGAPCWLHAQWLRTMAAKR